MKGYEQSMGDNRVRYAPMEREQRAGTQPPGRPGRTRPAGYPGRAQRERAAFLQQLQRQKRINRRLTISIVITWVLLLCNMAFSAGIYLQVRGAEGAFAYTGRQRTLSGMEPGTNGEDGRAEAGVLSVPDRADRDGADRAVGRDYIALCGLESVDRPRERTMEQVFDRLEELAEEDPRIAQILEGHSFYPDKLLEALANNPEMTDFVLGYPDSDGSTDGTLTAEETKQDYPLFLQWDPRWGYGKYGDGSNIAIAGCGPTCLSMALYYLTRDESLTPDKLAEYSMKNGYYVSGTGTAWALLQDVPEQHGIAVDQPKAEEDTMKLALDGGRVIICSMGPGDFTAAGHFIVIYGYDRTGFLVNDPNCIARSRQSWSFTDLKGQIKNIWVLGGSARSVTDYGYK